MGVVRCFVVLLLASSATEAGQRPIIGGDRGRDSRQTLLARKLLADDPELAAVNIGVVVTDRVAVLWGPVPSAEIALQAEHCLRRMAELTKIENELFVSGEIEPMRVPLKIDTPPQPVPRPVPTPPTAPAESRPMFGAPGVLTTRVEVKVLRPEPPRIVFPRESEPIGPLDADRELTAAIRTLLQGNRMFAPVQVRVDGRRVFLKAPDQDTDALHEAAHGIARLPGVEGVILEKTPR